jgi:N-acetylmuramoyl-L-alanine amidase
MTLLLVSILALQSCGSRDSGWAGSDAGDGVDGSGTLPWARVVVTGSIVNLRSGPGTQYPVTGTVSDGDTLMVLAEAGDWLRVHIPEQSVFAWIYGDLTTDIVE